MATFESNLIKKLNRHRGIYSGRPYQIAGRIILPAGTELATSDVLLFAPIGEQQRVKKVGAYINKGALPTATGSIGFNQILVDGVPAVVDRLGPLGESDSKYTSPSTNATAFATAAVFSTAREVVVPDGLALTGPVNLSMTVATGGTVGVDGVEIVCYAEFDGETNPLETPGDTWNADQSYLLGED